jgi:hypothetical protein
VGTVADAGGEEVLAYRPDLTKAAFDQEARRYLGPFIRQRTEVTEDRLVHHMAEWNRSNGCPWSEERLRQEVEETVEGVRREIDDLRYLDDRGIWWYTGQELQARLETGDGLEWAVENVLVKDQPVLIGGPKKTLKTSLAVDLAVSLATATPFLGRFKVPEPTRVLLISGESGTAALGHTARRVYLAKNLLGAPDGVSYVTRLPPLGNAGGLQTLEVLIRRTTSGIVVIDPLYLALMKGVQGKNAANLFDMGPLLSEITERCLEGGCTPILIHHANKRIEPSRPMELDDLAFAGTQEFARQWILVNRRGRYKFAGRHELILNVGGSAGHSSLWDVTVDEGELNPDFTGRKWDVKVEPHTAKGPKVLGPESKEPGDKVGAYAGRVLGALKELPPETDDGWVRQNAVKKGTSLNGQNFPAGVTRLEEDGLVERTSRTVRGRAVQYLRVRDPGRTRTGSGQGLRTEPL